MGEFEAWLDGYGEANAAGDGEDKTALLFKRLVRLGQMLELMHHAIRHDNFGELEAAISGDLLSMLFARDRRSYGIIMLLLLADYGEAGGEACTPYFDVYGD